MSAQNMVLVYRFRHTTVQTASPQHMWGTVEAIASLRGCEPLVDTARRVHSKLLEDGFLYEHTATTYLSLDEPPMPSCA
jgi:hypothetical protein